MERELKLSRGANGASNLSICTKHTLASALGSGALAAITAPINTGARSLSWFCRAARKSICEIADKGLNSQNFRGLAGAPPGSPNTARNDGEVRTRLQDLDHVRSHCRSAMMRGASDEIHLLILDADFYLIEEKSAKIEDLNSVRLGLLALYHQVSCIPAHNLLVIRIHGGHISLPTSDDIAAAIELQTICKSNPIVLVDYVVCSSKGEFSFRGAGLLTAN